MFMFMWAMIQMVPTITPATARPELDRALDEPRRALDEPWGGGDRPWGGEGGAIAAEGSSAFEALLLISPGEKVGISEAARLFHLAALRNAHAH